MVDPPPRVVEAFPDSKMAAYTRSPLGLTARARGSTASIAIAAGGAARSAGSKTRTWLTCPQETKARCGLPAKTTSAGSSPVASVATTRKVARSTMLTLSETWFTTHASPSLRARTDTGSRPTGMAARRTGAGAVRS